MADVELPNPEDVEEQRKDNFTKAVALSVAVYAVVLAIASLGGNNATKEANMTRLNESNQWAYYQAKADRENQYRIARSRLQLDLLSMSGEQREEAEKKLAEYEAAEKRYNSEKQDIEVEAKKYQTELKVHLRKDPYFDYAEVLLQIAIVIASVSMLANSRPVYFLSILIALGGAFLTINGFLLTVSLPFLES